MKINRSGMVLSLLLLTIIFNVQSAARAQKIRLASFNIKEMSSEKLQDVDENGVGRNAQLRAAAEIIRRIDADILVLNEIDHDYSVSDAQNKYTVNCERFLQAYLAQADYQFIFAAPCNTGHLSGFDFNNDGLVATEKNRGTREHGDDCYGWGTYPGQYSMAVLSKYPIRQQAVRTFQKFLWQDLPGHHMPPGYYSAEEQAIFRLSSKSHWDVPVQIGEQTLHLLLSHPTPPVFDGPEDKNGRRNFDEIKFWKLYLDNSPAIYDDSGVKGGFKKDEAFAIMGDLNAALQSNSRYDGQIAIMQLLQHWRVQDSGPAMTSDGAKDGIIPGAPDYFEQATTEFRKGRKRRIDYILPSRKLHIIKGGVYWPAPEKEPQLNSMALKASDHRAVWLDITWAM